MAFFFIQRTIEGMKLLSLMILSMSFSVLAKATIFTCLGKEEEKIHIKKTHGPQYDLNQKLISLMSKHSDQISFSADKIQENCQSFYPSLSLLQSIMLYRESFFASKSKSGSQSFLEDANQIFLNYLSVADQHAPSHDCLDRYLIGYKSLKKRMQFLSDTISPNDIIRSTPSLTKLVMSLDKVQTYYKQCRKDLKKKKK